MSETDDVKRPWDHGADFYSTSDQDERLTLEDLDECLEEYFEWRDGAIEEVAANGVTVYAWRRMVLDIDAEAKRYLDRFVADMCKSLADEFGDLKGDWKGSPTKDVDVFKELALPALRTLLSTVKPLGCSQVGEKTFTADELLAWVREHNPSWLEGKS